jgi:penicillin-binding protein 2
MIQLPEDRRPPLSPQLAMRVAVIGGFALAMFAIIFFRLWFLQVLSGDQYLAQASTNRTRDIAIPAQRGDMVDRSGTQLVESRQAVAIQLDPVEIPQNPAARDAMFGHLSGVLGMSTRPVRCRIAGQGVKTLGPIDCKVAQQHALLPYANVTVKTDVSKPVFFYLAERQEQFPGVLEPTVFVRNYPLHDLAAQLFGTVGPINAAELRQAHFKGVSQNSIVGQTGLEYSYDHYLRGTDGADRVQVNASGRFTKELAQQSPVAGHTLKLSVDVGLQKAGEQALSAAIANNPPADAGAFVALDPRNGEVLAMGSNPTFDPNVFVKPLSSSAYAQLNNASSNFPLIDRALQSAYPTGSTFKAITATAALQSGAWNLSDTFDDTGSFTLSGGLSLHNAGHAAYGSLDMVNAIRVSSDIFFYNLGQKLNVDPSKAPDGGQLQVWARKFGIGQPTGIDLGGEVTGTLPTPNWRAKRNQLELECEQATGPFKGKPRHSSCGIADGRPWSEGDNVNLAVGQGDLQATPLQLAVAYSAIENGGTIIRPHVGLQIENPDGTVLQKIDPPAQRHVSIDPVNLDAIRSGLHAAAQSGGGTSDDVFGNFPEPVYGKTGTAQRGGNTPDQSWYVCFVPDPKRPILVAVTVEQGGFGAAAAAPAARQILSQWFFGNRGKFVAGTSKTL